MLYQLIVLPLVRKHFSVFGIHSNSVPLDTITNAEKQDVEEANELSVDEILKQFNDLRVLHTVYEGDEEEDGSENPEAVVKCSPVCGPSNIPLKQILTTPSHLSFRMLHQRKHLSIWQHVTNILDKFRASTFDHVSKSSLN